MLKKIIICFLLINSSNSFVNNIHVSRLNSNIKTFSNDNTLLPPTISNNNRYPTKFLLKNKEDDNIIVINLSSLERKKNKIIDCVNTTTTFISKPKNIMIGTIFLIGSWHIYMAIIYEFFYIIYTFGHSLWI